MVYKNSNCPIYKKHHNIIDGIYMLRLPNSWEEIPYIDYLDTIDDDGELYSLLNDIIIYDIENIGGFELPSDNHNIIETIFIIRRNGNYYLCETQGESYIKFSTNISNLEYIKIKDRTDKLKKVYEELKK